MNILIVGYGFVGTATEYLFRNTDVDIDIDDPAKMMFADKDSYDYIFLCVPTPLVGNSLDISVLSECYEYWKDKGTVVIRSTIGPDQVPEFPGAIMMPEFLRERHWKEDVDDPLLPIIVGDGNLCQTLQEYFPHKRCYYVSNVPAMMYKLARNTALAMRVAIANEFYQICNDYHMNYDMLHSLLEADPVVGGTHWNVPGPDGNFGFGGKCLPKDLTHMASLCSNNPNVFLDALVANKMRRTDL